MQADLKHHLKVTKRCKGALKKKIMKKKLDSNKVKKINSKTNFSTIKNLANSGSNHLNHTAEKKIDSDNLLEILKSLASDPER